MATALRERALPALPTLSAFERDLDSMPAGRRAGLIERADAVLAHSFDLLGSGPTELGREIDWRRDFKSGRVWPLAHISQLPLAYADGSDIKVPWELSRFQHLAMLAAAWRLTGERRYVDEIGAQLDSWIAANPVECGPNWACTMDVAIRAANWVAALALVADDVRAEPWLERAASSLLVHCRFIRSHLETGRVRGNHYLSDVVGLLLTAALFSDSDEGRRWVEWSATQLVREMAHQVRQDGCAHEASTSYHRLVTELFVCGTGAADALVPGALPDWYRARLVSMLQFVADYTRPDGLAPLIGDADDGRFLPLGDYGIADQRSHMHLFEQAAQPYVPGRESAAYPAGGFYVVRTGDLHVVVRCGDTGLGGLGAHAHNDQLSFELSGRGRPMVIDPGSYVYTADSVARRQFRSTAFHSTVRIDGAEQNDLHPERPFELRDRTRAEALAWWPQRERTVFTGRHHGYEHLPVPAVHTRSLTVARDRPELVIEDTVESGGAHALEWSFPLAQCVVRVEGAVATASFEGAELTIESHDAELAVAEGWYSPRYGVRIRTPVVRAVRRSSGPVEVTRFVLRVG
jgi:hypothetical protein